jgi:hypothetical protein
MFAEGGTVIIDAEWVLAPIIIVIFLIIGFVNNRRK